jgi:hypothetical protein
MPARWHATSYAQKCTVDFKLGALLHVPTPALSRAPPVHGGAL